MTLSRLLPLVFSFLLLTACGTLPFLPGPGGGTAPTALDDGFSITAEVENTIDAPGVLENDSAPDGGTLTAELASAPAHGTLDFNADGSFSYTPDAGFSGQDTFTYRARAGGVSSEPATVTLRVSGSGGNTAPVVGDDRYAVAAGSTRSVAAPGVLANDVDADGDTLSARLVAGPDHGTLQLNADGSFSYTPDAGFTGEDAFTYRASDGSTTSAIATVTLTVSPAGGNAPPVANDDTYSTTSGSTLSVPALGVLDNDSDAEDDTLTAELASGPDHGTLQLNADGSFSYTPDPGFAGEDTFTYRASDGANRSTPATVTIRVAAVTPSAEPDAYAVVEDNTRTVAAPGVLANDSDPNGDPLTAELVAGPSHGTLTLNPDGSFSYTPDAGFTGEDTFTYRASDGANRSTPATVVVTVAPAGVNARIEVENLAGVPYPDRLVMFRIRFSVTDHQVHDTATLRVRNPGSAPLTVTQLSISAPSKFVLPNGETSFTVPPGGQRDLQVRFVHDATTGLQEATLTLKSNAANAPTTTVQLAGYAQGRPEGAAEMTLQDIVATFDYRVNLTDPGVNPQGVIDAYYRPHGEEMLAPRWKRADPAKPVDVVQLAALHGCCTDANFLRIPGAGSVTHHPGYGQSLLPHSNADPDALTKASFTPSGSFEIQVTSVYSTERGVQGRPVGVRLWPLRDRTGALVPDTYLVAQDNVKNSFTPDGEINFDFNDNVYLISNITPAVHWRADTGTSAGFTQVDSAGNKWWSDKWPNAVDATPPDAQQRGEYRLFTPTDAPNEAPGERPIANTVDDFLYWTYRGKVPAGEPRTLTYRLPASAGTYDVRLHFAELFHSSAGKRLFDVSVEGRLVRGDLDIFAAAGGQNTALVLPVDAVSVNDGELTVTLSASVDFPAISAIEVLPQ